MTPFNPLAYINASIQNNIGSFKNYLLEAKKKKSKPTADEEFEAHMASLIPYAAMASKRIRERQDIEDTDRMARARYYEAKAAEYLEKIKGFQAARKLIGATEKAKAQAAVERLAARIRKANREEKTPPPESKSEEPNLFSGFSPDQGISSSVTPAEPRKARGKNKRTSEIAKGVIKQITGSGNGGLKPEHQQIANQIKRENANKGKPPRESKPRDDGDSDDSDSSSAEQAADRAARRREARRREAKNIADDTNKDKNKKPRPDSAA